MKLRFMLLIAFFALNNCDSPTPIDPSPNFEVTPASPILFRGMTVRLEPATTVTGSGEWSSSNSSVASVDATGIVTAGGLGSATIRETLANGDFGETTVTVVEGGGTLRLGYQTTCGVTTGGALYCWGNNSRGQVGIGNSISPQPTPAKVNGSLSFVSVSPGADATCSMTTTGPYCWGRFAGNVIGDGSTVPDPYSPVKVRGGDIFTKIESNGAYLDNACSGDFICNSTTCALTAAGSLYCWEATWWDPRALVLTPVAGAPAFKSISLGMGNVCGIGTDKKAYCMGSNRYGQLGIPATALPGPTISQPIGHNMSFQAISAGRGHTCAIDTAGYAWCFGANGSGQLGAPSSESCLVRFGSVPCRSSPMRVEGNYKFQAISAGSATPVLTGEVPIEGHTCGITVSQEIFCWGANGHGQLGNGTRMDSAIPVKISSGVKFRSVTTGFANTCALTNEGAAYCWGANESGELGTGGTTEVTVPAPVVGGLVFK